MKILISAYACRPNTGSEPGVGWNWAVQAARCDDVWLLTRGENRPFIEPELVRQPVPNLRVVYHDLPGLLSHIPTHNKPGSPSVYVRYYFWQLTGIAVARRLHRRLQFDVAHHVTFGSFRFPSLCSSLGIPFIWGPVGGAEQAPQALYRGLPLKFRLLEQMRNTSNKMARMDPVLRHTMSRASLILATTPQSKQALPIWARAKARVMDALGVDIKTLPTDELDMPKSGGKILFVGRLVHWKGADLAIEAFAEAVYRKPELKLIVIGTGPDDTRLKELAERRGVSHRVDFKGFVSDAQREIEFRTSDIYISPSLHDSGGMAVLEAMAHQLPIVCLNIGGPGMTVTDECGVAVEPGSRTEVVGRLADALVMLASSGDLRTSMGIAGHDRVRDVYNWEEKGTMISSLYSELARAAKGLPSQ